MLVSFAQHIYILLESDHEKKLGYLNGQNVIIWRDTGPKGHIIFLSFGQTLVHNFWSSTNNTSLMSEEIKIGTTLMISENTNNASSKKFILVNQNKPLPIF